MAKVADILAKYTSQSQMNTYADNNGFSTHLADSAIYAKANGLKGDDVTDDYTALNALITEIGIEEVEIYFSSGRYKIGTNITIPANAKLIFAKGAVLVPEVGVTITINGAIEA